MKLPLIVYVDFLLEHEIWKEFPSRLHFYTPLWNAWWMGLFVIDFIFMVTYSPEGRGLGFYEDYGPLGPSVIGDGFIFVLSFGYCLICIASIVFVTFMRLFMFLSKRVHDNVQSVVSPEGYNSPSQQGNCSNSCAQRETLNDIARSIHGRVLDDVSLTYCKFRIYRVICSNPSHP